MKKNYRFIIIISVFFFVLLPTITNVIKEKNTKSVVTLLESDSLRYKYFKINESREDSNEPSTFIIMTTYLYNYILKPIYNTII